MTSRSERMAPVQRVLGSAEKDRARDLGAAQRLADEAGKRLQDLQQYRDEYYRGFEQRARTGQSASMLRDYRAFLARLDDAIRQQEQIVLQAREGLAGSRQRWQSAARQVKAVDSVVDRWQASEKKSAERREQKESDEHSLQRALRAGNPSVENR